jgi:hypothetical protein
MRFGTRSIGSVLALAAIGMIAANAGISAINSTASTASRSPLIGRWSHLNTCQELVAALQKAGLAATAPAVAGGFFPNSTPQQLAAKSDLCSGAAPMKHSHFFTKHGTFGSLDQSGQQVDNGHYRLLSHHRLRINNGKFHYRIINGNRLQLAPIITAAMRSQALASPLSFSVAGWEVAVSYTGQTWKRVRCGAWCAA